MTETCTLFETKINDLLAAAWAAIDAGKTEDARGLLAAAERYATLALTDGPLPAAIAARLEQTRQILQ